MDKDGLFLDRMENEVHDAWKAGEITNFLRSEMLNVISDVRDEL